MGLFKKEACVLCAGKTGMLDKKCIDGKICKDCRDKLSVWFDDYKDSTQTDLLRQIQQKNIDEAEAAHHAFNRIYGESGVILIVEDKAAIYDNESFLACFFRSEYEMPAMSYGFQCTAENWPDIRKYQYYLALSREIKETIMGKDA